jgi:hypothetical protein
MSSEQPHKTKSNGKNRKKYRPWAEIVQVDDHYRAATDLEEKRNLRYERAGLSRDKHGRFIPAPRLIRQNEEFLFYINPPGTEHGPAHIHIFTRRNGDSNPRGLRVALVDDGVNGRYGVTFPYYREEELQNIPENGHNEHAEQKQAWRPRLRSRLKHNMNEEETGRAIQYVNEHIGFFCNQWNKLYKDHDFLQNDFITGNEVDGVYFGGRLIPPEHERYYMPGVSGKEKKGCSRC